MHNKGTYSASLGNLTRWLGAQAEELGVEIFPGFAAAEVLFNDDGSVRGVATGDMGVARDGTHRGDYQPGMELHARYTLFAEGARGHLTKELARNLRPAQGVGAAGLRHRDQGVVGRSCRQASARAGDPHAGLAARRRVGRGVPLPPGQWPGRARLRRRARLQEPLSVAVRGIPALEIAPRDPRRDRGRQARQLRLRAPSTKAGGRRFRSWPSRAARWSAARRGSSTCRGSRAATRR